MYAEGGCIKLIILLDTPPLFELSLLHYLQTRIYFFSSFCLFSLLMTE